MDIYLVRHTKPDIAAGICYGQSDLDVADSFADELAALLPKLKTIENPLIYSSPLRRCAKLAEGFCKAHALLPAIHDVRLKELNFGDWELCAWEDIPRGMIEIWAEDHLLQAPPNGESFQNLFLRAKAFLDEVSAQPSRPLIVFTHAGVIRALTGYALGLPLCNTFRLEVDYASVTKIVVKPQVMHVGFINR